MSETNKTLLIICAACVAICEAIVVGWFSYGLGKTSTNQNVELRQFQEQAVALGVAEWKKPADNWIGASDFRWIVKGGAK